MISSSKKLASKKMARLVLCTMLIGGLVSFSGCKGKKKKNTTIGAVVGAAAGAGVGAAFGGGTGAVIGAPVGAVVGGSIGYAVTGDEKEEK